MLKIYLPPTDEYNGVTLELEHSLVSLSKWESIHEKPFYRAEAKTVDETLSYIRQMIVSDVMPFDFDSRITPEMSYQVNEYINKKSSATWFTEDGRPPKRSTEIMTSELVYYWMTLFNIPFHPAETWHLNRLLTLIKICSVKQEKPKPVNRMSQHEQMRALNEKRKKELGTSG